VTGFSKDTHEIKS